MVINPNGTLFFRPAEDDGRQVDRRLMNVYGLIQGMKGIEGEQQFLCEVRSHAEGIRFRLDTAVTERPDFGPLSSHLMSLGDLTQERAIWQTDPKRPGVGMAFIRRTEVPSPTPGREMYLVAAVVNMDRKFCPPRDSLVDLRFGESIGRPTVHQAAIGASVDKALRNPFFLNGDGNRYAIASTLSPEGQAQIQAIRDVCSKPAQQMKAGDRDRIAAWKANPELALLVSHYEKPTVPHFIPYVRAMRTQELPGNAFISAEQIQKYDAVARATMMQAVASTRATAPKAVPQMAA